jgi:hypothetical protein
MELPVDKAALPVVDGMSCCGGLATVAAMTAWQELHRQVRQNGNDIKELYGLSDETNKKVTAIAEVQQEHGHWLENIESRIGTQDGKLDEILGILKAP